MRKAITFGVLALAVAGGVAATRPLLVPAVDRSATMVSLPLPEAATGPVNPGALMPQPPAELDGVPIAMLYDLHSGQTLYSRAIDQAFLPASVTKVMTLYTAFDLIAQGKLSPGTTLTVGDKAWQQWHAKGSRMFLARGSRVSVHDLLMGIANVSANDGCVVLAEGVAGSVDGWVALMNAEARKLGMDHSHFGTPMGWMDQGHTYYTARDLTRLAQAMISRFPEDYHTYIGKPGMTWNGITQPNHDPTLGVIPGADGIKTGFTDEAGYNFLGSAERDGRRLIMVIAHMPNGKARAKVSRALLDWGFSAWESRQIFPEGRILADADVQRGMAPRVGLETAQVVTMTMPRGVTAPVKARVRYNGPLVAPIARGQEVAVLEVRVGQQPPAEVPLIAADDVPRADGMVERVRAGLAGLIR